MKMFSITLLEIITLLIPNIDIGSYNITFLLLGIDWLDSNPGAVQVLHNQIWPLYRQL